MNRFFRFIGAIVSTLAILFGLFLIVDTYVAGVLKVGNMTVDGLLESDDIVIVEKLTQKFKTLSRFDFLVFKHPETGEIMIQRIIGLPGEKVDYLQNQLFINNTQIDEPFLPEHVPGAEKNYFSAVKMLPDTAGMIPPQHYIVINDNRADTNDSRSFGALSEKYILGVIKARIYPFNRFAILAKMRYNL